MQIDEYFQQKQNQIQQKLEAQMHRLVIKTNQTENILRSLQKKLSISNEKEKFLVLENLSLKCKIKEINDPIYQNEKQNQVIQCYKEELEQHFSNEIDELNQQIDVQKQQLFQLDQKNICLKQQLIDQQQLQENNQKLQNIVQKQEQQIKSYARQLDVQNVLKHSNILDSSQENLIEQQNIKIIQLQDQINRIQSERWETGSPDKISPLKNMECMMQFSPFQKSNQNLVKSNILDTFQPKQITLYIQLQYILNQNNPVKFSINLDFSYIKLLQDISQKQQLYFDIKNFIRNKNDQMINNNIKPFCQETGIYYQNNKFFLFLIENDDKTLFELVKLLFDIQIQDRFDTFLENNIQQLFEIIIKLLPIINNKNHTGNQVILEIFFKSAYKLLNFKEQEKIIINKIINVPSTHAWQSFKITCPASQGKINDRNQVIGCRNLQFFISQIMHENVNCNYQETIQHDTHLGKIKTRIYASLTLILNLGLSEDLLFGLQTLTQDILIVKKTNLSNELRNFILQNNGISIVINTLKQKPIESIESIYFLDLALFFEYSEKHDYFMEFLKQISSIKNIEFIILIFEFFHQKQHLDACNKAIKLIFNISQALLIKGKLAQKIEQSLKKFQQKEQNYLSKNKNTIELLNFILINLQQ